jgi:hypothetical protein
MVRPKRTIWRSGGQRSSPPAGAAVKHVPIELNRYVPARPRAPPTHKASAGPLHKSAVARRAKAESRDPGQRVGTGVFDLDSRLRRNERSVLQRIRMLSGLPGRPVLPAIRTGFSDTFLVAARATEWVGLVSAAAWTGVASGGA